MSRENLGWKWWVLVILGIVALVFGLWCLMAWLFGLLWNWLVPDLFNGPTITFWQAFGVMLLLSFVGSAARGCTRTKSRD